MSKDIYKNITNRMDDLKQITIFLKIKLFSSYIYYKKLNMLCYLLTRLKQWVNLH